MLPIFGAIPEAIHADKRAPSSRVTPGPDVADCGARAEARGIDQLQSYVDRFERSGAAASSPNPESLVRRDRVVAPLGSSARRPAS